MLIVSGPTREPLDPVRYLSNYSTGTIGRYLVQTATKRAHQVDWVECPRMAETARELERLLRARIRYCDVLIMAAAVCDVRPRQTAAGKIKKDGLVTLSLVKNPDILAGLAAKKRAGQVFIGFGLESTDLLKNGRDKLDKKGLELIVLQKVTKYSKPFGEVPVDAVLLDRTGRCLKYPGVIKRRLAAIIIKEAEKLSDGQK